MPHLRLHGSHCLPYPSDSLRPRPTQLLGPSKLFPVAFPYKWLVLAHVSIFPSFSQTSSICLRQTPYLLLSCLRPGISSSWPWLQLGFTWGPPRPVQVAAICSCFVAYAVWLWTEHNWWLTFGHARSNQGSTATRGCAQPTWLAHLEYPAWVIIEAVPLDWPYRIPTSTLGHSTKAGRHNSST